jgi:tetratricopeptide (TPR) repeat protein
LNAETQPTLKGFPKAGPLLLLSGLLAYSSAVNTGFVLDDLYWIVRHPQLGNAKAYISESIDRGLVALTIVLNHRLGGTNPVGYHLLNVGMHLVSGFILYGLLVRVLSLPRWGERFSSRAGPLAFASALLWLVHPLNTQAVTYVIQRAESMMGLFFLLTFYCWTRGVTEQKKGLWHTLAVLSFAASCLCKEVAVTLPVLLVLYDRVFLSSRWSEVASRWASYLGLALVWAIKLNRVLAGAFAGGESGTGVGFGIAVTPTRYALTQTEVILHYMRLAIWPVGQVGDYNGWRVAQSISDVWPSAIGLGLILLASGAVWIFRPIIGFLAAWFFGILAPTSSIMPINDVAYEHRMYLSLCALVVGFILALDSVIQNYGKRLRYHQGAFWVGVVVLAVCLGRTTFVRNRVYQSEIRFWADVYSKHPENGRAASTVAAALMDEGRWDEVAQIFDRVAESDKVNVEWQYRANHLVKRGDYATASRLFQAWFEHASPYTVRFLGRLAVRTMLASGDAEAAVATARRLVADSPNSGEFHFLLAVAERRAGNTSNTQELLQKAIDLDAQILARTAAEARASLFQPITPSNNRKGQWELAYRLAEAICQSATTHPEWWDTWALAAARTGRFPEAVEAARRGIAAAETVQDRVWVQALTERKKLYEKNQIFGPNP